MNGAMLYSAHTCLPSGSCDIANTSGLVKVGSSAWHSAVVRSHPSSRGLFITTHKEKWETHLRQKLRHNIWHKYNALINSLVVCQHAVATLQDVHVVEVTGARKVRINICPICNKGIYADVR
jgi:hypothetical protein